jgi:hypothetical protein
MYVWLGFGQGLLKWNPIFLSESTGHLCSELASSECALVADLFRIVQFFHHSSCSLPPVANGAHTHAAHHLLCSCILHVFRTLVFYGLIGKTSLVFIRWVNNLSQYNGQQQVQLP